MKALPDGHCWLNTNPSAEIQRRKKSAAGRDSERQRSSTFQGHPPSLTPCSRAPAAQKNRELCQQCPPHLAHLIFPASPLGAILYPLLPASPKAAAHIGSGKRGTVTFCQTYCASLGFKTLQAAPSKPSLSECIFPALCLLAEDGLLNTLS